jgi:hypothetical protein
MGKCSKVLDFIGFAIDKNSILRFRTDLFVANLNV